MLGGRYYPPRIGGIEKHLFGICPPLVSKGYDIHVIVGQEPNRPATETIDGVHIYRVPYNPIRALNKISMVSRAFKLVNQINLDVIHAHDAVMGYNSSKRYPNKTIYTAHGIGYLRNDWNSVIRRILKRYETYSFKHARRILTVDGLSKSEIGKYRKTDVSLINIGINIYDKTKTTCPSEYSPETVNLLTVGRMIESKGFQVLIEAFKQLPPGIKNKARLFLIGDGQYRETLVRLINSESNIKHLGLVKDITPYFAYADCFILPSFYEGLPATLLEAMGAGLACISTDISDIKTRFPNKELMIVPPNDIPSLKQALITLISNNDFRSRLGANSINIIKRDYSWSQLVNQLDHEYQSIIKGGTT
jgi:glycosyltransferase involved in cell wall biosynthesis